MRRADDPGADTKVPVLSPRNRLLSEAEPQTAARAIAATLFAATTYTRRTGNGRGTRFARWMAACPLEDWKMGKKALVVVLGAAAVIGLKFYNKASAHDDVRGQLVALCDGDAVCERAVETHFDTCFESAYRMGGRRRSARMETGQLVQCLNAKADRVYFVYGEK